MNHRRIFSLFLLALAPAGATPLTRDLGQGLAYFRAQELPLELPAAGTARAQACVLDLRYARGDENAATTLEAWLKFRAISRAPVFVLANGETAPALLTVLAPGEGPAGLVVIGVAARGFYPALAVQSTPENERRAYDALEKGASLASLLVENPDKLRHDEASLARDRPAEGVAEEKAKPPAPPIDAALQRAVHLHRALRALKKIE